MATAWSFFAAAPDDLPPRIEPVKGRDVNLAIFVDGAITKIYNEASGRYKDQRQLKEACKHLIDELRKDDSEGGFTLRVPLNNEEAKKILAPLKLACAMDIPRITEPALSCLHKLVAHTYLQGETSHTGALTDGTPVATVTALVSKCGDYSNEAVQLAVIRALLTFATADHFVLHGESLMQAVRTVFNISINSDSESIKRTANNALLQMLNTILKRVTQGIHYARGSSISFQSMSSFAPESRVQSFGADHDALRPQTPQVLEVQPDAGLSVVDDRLPTSAPRVPVPEWPAAADHQGHQSMVAALAADCPAEEHASPTDRPQESPDEASSRTQSQPPVPQGDPSFSYLVHPNGHQDTVAVSSASAQEGDKAAAGSVATPDMGASDQAAELTQAERESSLVFPTANMNGHEDSVRAGMFESKLTVGQNGHHSNLALGNEQMVSAEMHAATLASLAEQVDIRGIERALEKDGGLASPEAYARTPAESETSSRPPSAGPDYGSSGQLTSLNKQGPADGSKDLSRRALMRDGAHHRWKHLNVLERDVLLVLNAICKMAAREASSANDNGYLLKGKLSALDLLVRVMDNPLHHWETVRQDFCSHLRQPLCLALLRNCTASSSEVYSSSVRLLSIVLERPNLRASIKAELGALYPLLVLRPMEADRIEATQLLPALQTIVTAAKDAQLMVDLFVNYDCSLQAANLFERTCKGLARVAKGLDPALGIVGPQAVEARDLAVRALQECVNSLDHWAKPLKDAAAAAAAAAEDVLVTGGSGPTCLTTQTPRTSAFHPGGLPGMNEAAVFEAAKEKKHSLESAVALFNEKPIRGVALMVANGLVEDDTTSLATFLKEQLPLLDKTMLGEYFGHHEQKEIDVMHAFVDLDRYHNVTIDVALRKLLSSFRLPGESQKIDRIMEKFAERYCKDNPKVFRNAGDAYVLAFAIIMLNTDAHNPMAERRLTAFDFISMNQTQVDDGDYAPILPEADLQAIFDRITTNAIEVPAGHADSGKAEGTQAGARSGASGAAPFMKLAASMGITQLLLPFRSGDVWDKQHGVDIERKWLLNKTRELMSQGSAAGLLWHNASHSEHARPMLQVSQGNMMRSFMTALSNASTAEAAQSVLDSVATLIRLAGILGLQHAMEDMVEVLAIQTGVAEPAPQGSLLEAKQVVALHTLLSIASGPEGALLGPAWLTVLRVLSTLQALQQDLLPKPNAAGSVPLSFDQPVAPYNTLTLVDKARRTGLHQQGGMTRLMSLLTPRGNGEAPSAASPSGQTDGRNSPPHIEPEDVAAGLGHGLVQWSIQPTGESLIDAIFLRSCGLDGDAVIAFFRALCAMSQEELTPANPDDEPRIYMLRQLVDCALLNMGRIRLVLTKIWAVVAPHLVSAACAPSTAVAKYAVEALRQLIDKLLLRAELANFTYQEEALRPFVLVLKHCDGPTVREFAVRCIASSITDHPRGLGSGWRSLLQALTTAATDHGAAVVNQALDALQPVVEALYRNSWGGHTYLQECIAAVMAAVRNRSHAELSISAVYMLHGIARRIAASEKATSAEEEDDDNPASTHDASASQQERISSHAEAGPGPGTWETIVGAGSSASPRGIARSPSGMPNHEAWLLLLGTLAQVARMDGRAQVADAAAQVAFDVVKEYSATWDVATFMSVLTKCILYIFDLPHRTYYTPDAVQQPLEPEPNVEDAIDNGNGFLLYDVFPAAHAVTANADRQRHSVGINPRTHSTAEMNGTSKDMAPGQPDVNAMSVEGIVRVERQARRLLSQLWELCAQQYSLRGTAMLQQVLSLMVRYVLSNEEGICFLGVLQLQAAADQLGQLLDGAGWHVFVRTLSVASSTDHLISALELRPGVSTSEARAVEDVIRCRCALVVCCQRLVGEVVADWQHCMPSEYQLQLLGVLKDTVDRAMSFNKDAERRHVAQWYLAGSRPQGPGAGIRSQGGSRSSKRDAGGGLSRSGTEDGIAERYARGQGAGISAAAAEEMGHGLESVLDSHRPPRHPAAADGNSGTPVGISTASQHNGGRHHDPVTRSETPPPYLRSPTSHADTPGSDATADGRSRRYLATELVTSALESLQPAMLRQEVEGGLLLITALVHFLKRYNAQKQQRASTPGAEAGVDELFDQLEGRTSSSAVCTPDAIISEATMRRGQLLLLDICRKVVATATNDVLALERGGKENVQTWEMALRSPLTIHALRAYLSLELDELRDHVGAVFRDLAILVRAQDITVRQEVQQLLQGRIQPLLIADLPAMPVQ